MYKRVGIIGSVALMVAVSTFGASEMHGGDVQEEEEEEEEVTSCQNEVVGIFDNCLLMCGGNADHTKCFYNELECAINGKSFINPETLSWISERCSSEFESKFTADLGKLICNLCFPPRA